MCPWDVPSLSLGRLRGIRPPNSFMWFFFIGFFLSILARQKIPFEKRMTPKSYFNAKPCFQGHVWGRLILTSGMKTKANRSPSALTGARQWSFLVFRWEMLRETWWESCEILSDRQNTAPKIWRGSLNIFQTTSQKVSKSDCLLVFCLVWPISGSGCFSVLCRVVLFASFDRLIPWYKKDAMRVTDMGCAPSHMPSNPLWEWLASDNIGP